MDEFTHKQNDPIENPGNAPPSGAVADEEIHDSSYGLNRRGRAVLMYIITAFICAAIIAGSYALAIVLPSNTQAT
ncbi:MAG: hypothetical protein IJH94_02280, partial [Clostridia bacterium]|nr:hypothetical protein [Clostridia bacterium]